MGDSNGEDDLVRDGRPQRHLPSHRRRSIKPVELKATIDRNIAGRKIIVNCDHVFGRDQLTAEAEGYRGNSRTQFLAGVLQMRKYITMTRFPWTVACFGLPSPDASHLRLMKVRTLVITGQRASGPAMQTSSVGRSRRRRKATSSLAVGSNDDIGPHTSVQKRRSYRSRGSMLTPGLYRYPRALPRWRHGAGHRCNLRDAATPGGIHEVASQIFCGARSSRASGFVGGVPGTMKTGVASFRGGTGLTM